MKGGLRPQRRADRLGQHAGSSDGIAVLRHRQKRGQEWRAWIERADLELTDMVTGREFRHFRPPGVSGFASRGKVRLSQTIYADLCRRSDTPPSPAGRLRSGCKKFPKNLQSARLAPG